jgi:UDP-N-acetylglucosamine 4-epimerase
MKRILVTGGAGFIGSHICDFLLDKGYQVRVVDNLTTGKKENIQNHLNNPNFEFIQDDINNLDSVRKICKDVSSICHQAAVPSVPRSILDPLTSHNTNVNGFLNILLVAKELGIKRIVYASSSSVYGDSPVLPKTEDKIGNQLSPYAINKYVDELYANLFGKLYGLECIGLRYFNIFGPRQDPKGPYGAVIPKFIQSLCQKKPPIINGNAGSFSRDFTYIDNAVFANFLALTSENDLAFNQVFNVGCGGNYTILYLFNLIKHNLDVNIEPEYGNDRRGDIPHSLANISKIEEILGYSPRVSFEEGIIRTISYFKSYD